MLWGASPLDARGSPAAYGACALLLSRPSIPGFSPGLRVVTVACQTARNDMAIRYTGEMTPEQTIAEIRKCLVQHGALAIMTDYNKQTGKPSALTFEMKLGDQSLIFRLPCDWRPVYLILTIGLKFNSRDEERNIQRKKRYFEQAERTAWRMKDWVDAQMALVESRMIAAPQAFLPYAIMEDGKTLSEAVAQNPQFLFGTGNSNRHGN